MNSRIDLKFLIQFLTFQSSLLYGIHSRKKATSINKNRWHPKKIQSIGTRFLIISIEFRSEEIRKRQRKEHSLPVPLHYNMQREQRSHKVYTQKKDWTNDDPKYLALLNQQDEEQMDQNQLEQKEENEREKEREELKRQVKLEYEKKTTAQLNQFLKRLCKKQSQIRNERNQNRTYYKYLTSERTQLQICLAYEMKRNYAMSNINKIKSLVEKNENEISDYYDKQDQFQKELEEILLKKAVVKKLKIDRIDKE